MRIATIVAAVIVFAIVGVLMTGAALWSRESDRIIRRLDERNRATTVTNADVFSYLETDGLPPPVARYFRFALTSGQPIVQRARLTQAGDFAMRPGAWRAFTAVEIFTVRAPGFVWDARIGVAPLTDVRVRDGYDGGAGELNARLAGLLSVAHAKGTPELSSGEVMRYLAELVWLPTALLPRAGVRWSAVSDSAASVTLRDGATTVSLTVRFGAQGEITEVSGMRYQDMNGAPVLTPWLGRFADYRRESGMMIPMSGSVAWMTDGREAQYWRGRIVRAEYQFEGVQPAP